MANKHRQGCSTSLMIREILTKGTWDTTLAHFAVKNGEVWQYQVLGRTWINRTFTEPAVPCWGGGECETVQPLQKQLAFSCEAGHSNAPQSSNPTLRNTLKSNSYTRSSGDEYEDAHASMIHNQHKSGNRTNELRQENGEFYCTVSIQCNNKPQLKWMNSSCI